MKRKNRIRNFIMVVLIFAMIGGAVLYAGNLKGWFRKDADRSNAVICPGAGSSSMTRGGVAYSLSEETPLRAGDGLKTAAKSTLILNSKETKLVLGPDSELFVKSASEEAFGAKLSIGELFIDIKGGDPIDISISDMEIGLKNGVYHISVQKGSAAVSVFSGEAVYAPGQSDLLAGSYVSSAAVSDTGTPRYTARAGEILSIVYDEVQVMPLSIYSLNDFTIENVKKTEDICFTIDELEKIVSDREKEKQAVLEELVGADIGDYTSSCTIQIICDSILDNMESITPGKDVYVPTGGIILPVTKVGLSEDDTAFDVLKKVCDNAGIQLEYSWTPIYDSYYIEGINHIYEFDCGPESGWMYKVNGWFPNRGCSSYKLSDGDSVVFCYTCEGLGADVGGSVY